MTLSRWTIHGLWLSGFVLLMASWYLPLMTVSRFFIWNNELSIFSALADLTQQGHFLLTAVVLIASILLPVIKYLLIAWLLFLQNTQNERDTALMAKLHHWLHHLGRWSFIDIFVIALLVTGLKLRGLVEVEIEIGFYCFFYAALNSLLLLPLINYFKRATNNPLVHDNKTNP